MMEQLTATVLETTFRNDDNGYTVLRVALGRGQQTVVGVMPALSSGESVAFDGEWTRRRIDGPDVARKLSRDMSIPVYDAQVTGYPQRMRDYDARRRIEQRRAREAEQ